MRGLSSSRVEVYSRSDARAVSLARSLREDLGISCELVTADVYTFFDVSDIDVVIHELLSEPLVNECVVGRKKFPGHWVLEVSYRAGVHDPVELSALSAIRSLGVGCSAVRTSQKIAVRGISEVQARRVAGFVSNSIIQECRVGLCDVNLDIREPVLQGAGRIEEVFLLGVPDSELVEISRKGFLSLDLDEMRAIRDYFSAEGRNPADGELEAIAQTWSEHCKHKVFNSRYEYVENGVVHHIPNLFKSTIVKATDSISKPWLVSVFSDNAGIIEFDDRFGVAFKVETHNHPSALDPYGGAGTGIGGVIRDILGAGLGAKPILNTDIFCFAPPCFRGAIPDKVLHPKRIMKGVFSGVRDYGNRMGIPTVNGAMVFDDGFLGAPLVFCGTAGIIEKGFERKKVGDGELVVVVGGRTGRDGIHGATFSSVALDESSPPSAVQIGNAIVEKSMMDALLAARDRNLYTCIQDVGGGGFSSAIGEMGRAGVEVDLDKVPLKYEGMAPWEVWVSESQERMVVSVRPELVEEFMELCRMEGTEAAVIGRFNSSGRLVVRYFGRKLIDLDMGFLHDGLPKKAMRAVWSSPVLSEPVIDEPPDYEGVLLGILSHPTVASKEWFVRQYDHEVQAGTVIKPFVGVNSDGPGDASVVRPVPDSWKGVVVGNGINPRYSAIDTYWMAASAIDEALRNVVSVGGNFSHAAILDNFCWGGVSDEGSLGRLVRAARACHDFSVMFGAPFISGKDSLRNEFVVEGRRIGIPDTLLVSAVSVADDIRKCVTMDAKESGNSVYVVGKTYDELGGSYYYGSLGETGANVPKVRSSAVAAFGKLSAAISRGLVRSCHDCSEGGLGVALSEVAFSGGLGMAVDLAKVPYDGRLRSDFVLFSESNSRFVVEVEPGKEKQFLSLMEGVDVARVGEVKGERLVIIGLNGKVILDSAIGNLKDAWQGAFGWKK